MANLTTSIGAIFLTEEDSTDAPAVVLRNKDNDTFGGFIGSAGPPQSGTSGTGAGHAVKGCLCVDGNNGVAFINEGTQVSPYWSPISYDSPGLFGINTDFRDRVGEPVANTDAEEILVGNGLRIFGQGLEQAADSGVVVQAAGEGGSVGRISTTDEAAHVIALGMEAGTMQPDQHQLLVVEAEFSHVSAITDRATFIGFVGTAADALDPAVTGATTTATLVQNDLAGLFQDSGFTDADGLMAVSEKSNTAGTQTSLSASATLAAAGTFQRMRVEVDADGTARAFVDKEQVATIPGATGANTHSATETALDADEEVSPVLYLESNAAAIKSMDVRRFATWAYRL